MKRLLPLCSVLIALLLLSACNNASNTPTSAQEYAASIHSPGDTISDGDAALEYLKDGNRRFLDDKTIARDTNAADREVLKDGQHPFAVVLTCSDSRVSPEIYFDQKLGDIFVIRNAGNIADATTLGSIEYAVEHLNVPLVVVVGHSGCGAVTGAFNGGEYPENLKTIIDRISASIENSADLDEAIHSNINAVVSQINNDETVSETGAKIIGAHYDIETGEVSWLQ